MQRKPRIRAREEAGLTVGRGILGGDSRATRLAGSERWGKNGDILTNSPGWKLAVIWKSGVGSYELILLKDFRGRGACVAQLVGCPTSAQVMILWSVSFGLCADISEPGACFSSVSPSLPLPHSHSVSLCLSKIKKTNKKIFPIGRVF